MLCLKILKIDIKQITSIINSTIPEDSLTIQFGESCEAIKSSIVAIVIMIRFAFLMDRIFVPIKNKMIKANHSNKEIIKAIIPTHRFDSRKGINPLNGNVIKEQIAKK